MGKRLMLYIGKTNWKKTRDFSSLFYNTSAPLPRIFITFTVILCGLYLYQ